MSTLPHWMPELPLASSVPVRSRHNPHAVDVVLIGGGTRWYLAHNGWQDAKDWRVDLFVDRGYGHALQLWCKTKAHIAGYGYGSVEFVVAWLRGVVNDGHVMALAEALREEFGTTEAD